MILMGNQHTGRHSDPGNLRPTTRVTCCMHVVNECDYIVMIRVLALVINSVKIGTQNGYLSYESQRYLVNFTRILTDEVAHKTSEYLVLVWAGVKPVWWDIRPTSSRMPHLGWNTKTLVNPTSNVQCHSWTLQRAFLIMSKALCLLGDPDYTYKVGNLVHIKLLL